MNTTMYRHSVAENKKPRVTVSGVIKDKTLRIGVSRCSHKDSFAKETGRVNATERAESETPFVVVPLTGYVDPRKLFQWLATGIIKDALAHPQVVAKQKVKENVRC